MRIIDCHCHIYPQKIAQKAVEHIGSFYDLHMDCDGTPETLLNEGAAAGITDFVVHSVATTPHQVGSVNEFVSAEAKAHPELIGFGTLHPKSEDIEGDFDHLISLGLKGIKLHPDFLGIPIDDPSYFKIYELCSEAGLPICFHTGDKRYDYSNPNRTLPLARRFSSLKMIAAHFGAYTIWEEGAEYLAGVPNIMVDCSSSLPFLSAEAAVKIIRKFGAEKVLFGTDYPMWAPDKELMRFNSLPLTEDEREMIFHANAEALLKL